MHAIIDRIEKKVAVIRTSDSQTLLWDINNMPAHLSEGDEIVLEIKDINKAKSNQKALAREILNEIFNHEPHDRKQAALF